YEILLDIPGFERIAEVAAAHHEKLDGRGYWRGLTADHLDEDMRILAVADIYDALTADRPYRPAMPVEKAIRILREESVCQTCVDVVEGWN
ncbi:HD domain-containing phosphohydrolase, partial [Acinetobacter baumannii]